MNTDSNSKTILFLDAYFNPEITAYTHLENDLISEMDEYWGEDGEAPLWRKNWE